MVFLLLLLILLTSLCSDCRRLAEEPQKKRGGPPHHPNCVLSSRRSEEVQDSEVDVCPSSPIRVVRHGHRWDRVRRQEETFVWSTGEAGGNIRATGKPRNRPDPER